MRCKKDRWRFKAWEARNSYKLSGIFYANCCIRLGQSFYNVRTSEPIKKYRKYNQFLKVPISLNGHHTLLQMQVGLDEPSRHGLLLSVMVVLLNSIRIFLTKKYVYSIVLTTFLM